MTRLLVLVALAFALTSCDPDKDSPDSSVPMDASIDASSDSETALSCAQLRDCFDTCTDGDAACFDACVVRAATDALSTVLAACVDAADCSDAACITRACADELMCTGGGDAPVAIEGTVRDTLPMLGLDSNGTVRFERDDAAGEALGLDGPDTAFYRLVQVDYTATQMLDMGCVYSASETVSVTDPPALGNNITFNTTNGEYSIVTSLTETRPMALTLECPPPAGTMQMDFNAGLNISNGTTLPVSDGTTFRDTAMPPGGVDRVWSWDLTAVD